MSEQPAGSASGDENENMGGLLGRLQQRGQDLSRGRRIAIPVPGYEDVSGDGRGLWVRFAPLSRKAQQDFAWTPDSASQEVDVVVPILVALCEEVLIGTSDKRTPLADEPGFGPFPGPLRFDAELGQVLGVGGDTPAAVVKRVYIRGDDDLPLYAVWAELMNWSTLVYAAGVETAAGE